MIHRTILLLIFIIIICLIASLLSTPKKEIFKNFSFGDGSDEEAKYYASNLSSGGGGGGSASGLANMEMNASGHCNCCKCGWIPCTDCTKNIDKCCGGNFNYDRYTF